MSTTTPQASTYLNGEPLDPSKLPPGTVPLPAEEPPELEDDTPVVAEEENALDDIEKQVEHREWLVRGRVVRVTRQGGLVEEDFDRTYVQKPLSYTAMLQFTGLIGDRITSLMSGPDGLSLDDVMGDAEGIASASQFLTKADFSGVDSFVKGFAKVAQYLPDVIEEAQCIWLRVPLNERPAVRDIWSRSPADGGLTMAEGEEMLAHFLAQNYEEIEDFFLVRLPRQIALVQKLRAATQKRKGAASQRSKRSKPTQQPIQSP